MPEPQSSATAPARLQGTGKEYKICVAETPTHLENQVTDLLSEGWELHGYPFVHLQFGGNGDGHGVSGNLFCQAMVRFAGRNGAVAAAPLETSVGAQPAGVKKKSLPAKPVRPRAERPRVAPSFRAVATFLAVVAGGYLFVECLLFRSGFYARFVEPESATGSFERTFKAEKDRPASHKKEVLIVGSSRMAEGFSAKEANLYKPEEGYHFFNCAVPSAGPRTFYYMLRDLDPTRNRYAAITIPIDDYEDPDDVEDIADRASDLWLVINRLRFTDILPYTLSFPTWKSRGIVFRGALLKATVYQHDIADFIEHPSERLARVRMFRESGADWAYNYGGIEHNLAGMVVDRANRRVTFPPGMPLDTQHFLADTFFHQNPQRGRNRDFEIRWLSALADQYRGSKTRMIFFQAPRGPAPRPSPHLPFTIVDELRKRPWVTVIDPHRFESLERSELFADHVHLSSEGRKIFSPMLVDTVKEVLH